MINPYTEKDKTLHAYKVALGWKPTSAPTSEEWEQCGHLLSASSMQAAAERIREALKERYQNQAYYCWVMCCDQQCCTQRFKIENGVAYEG